MEISKKNESILEAIIKVKELTKALDEMAKQTTANEAECDEVQNEYETLLEPLREKIYEDFRNFFE